MIKPSTLYVAGDKCYENPLCSSQKPWLAPYIKANTKMRTKATNDFEKYFFKLMNNAFLGKTMENVRIRRNIDIMNDPERLNCLTAKPTYKSTVEISPQS